MGSQRTNDGGHYPTTKAFTHTIIGAISSVDVINLSICVPKRQPKLRKTRGSKKRKSPEIASKEEPKGTTASHYLRFLKKFYLGYYGPGL
jgi:hypothetical protein